MVYTHALLSRPEPQLTELAGGIRAVHLTPVCMPAFTFSATDESVVPDAAWRNHATRLLIFTSPRAVEFGLRALQDTMLQDCRVVSVGPATTRELAAAGLAALQAPGPTFDSDALLACVESQLQPGAAVILAAPGGREAIQDGLQEMGWQVRLVPVYRREPVDPDPLNIAVLEAAGGVLSIWTSGTAMDHLLSKLSARARDQVRAGTAIVVAERLVQRAGQLGFGDVRLATGASNSALLAAVDEVIA